MSAFATPCNLILACVSLRGGGTERIVTRLANAMAHRHRVGILTLAGTSPFFHLHDSVALFMPRPRGALTRSSVARRSLQMGHAMRTLQRERPTDLWVFGEEIVGVLSALGALSGARVVQFLRGTPRRSLEGVLGTVNPALARFASTIVVQTEEARVALSKGYPSAKLKAIPNPIEIPSTVRALEERATRVAYVASLGRRKNQDLLIRIFADAEFAPGWALDLIGDGSERERLERLASDLGAGDRVRFFGARQDVGELLQDVQVFAFPSLEEGFPNALAEALAAGCACVSYACPCGPSELIRDGENGLLAPTGDERRFRALLEGLLADEALRRKMSEEARRQVQKFSETAVLPAFEALLCDGERGFVG